MSNDKRWSRMEATRPPDGEAHGWIQWKGTNVCMDVHCICGAHGHVDEDFTYHYKCLACGRFFDVAGYVRLVEVPADEMTEDDLDGRCTASDNETLEHKSSGDNT
jgi:hypothetical protein